jgi:GNAT superfamily N-acetyltransferase
MEIKTYTAAQLVAFTDGQQFSELKHLPVSKLRALSHLHNPRVDAETPIMYMAWVDGEVAGYRMVLCDTLYANGLAQPVCWYSCVWVNPEMRGMGIAKGLVNRCLEDWGGRIFGADAVPESRSLYLSTGLYKGELYLEGTRTYLRANFADIIVKKKPSLSLIKPLLAIADDVLNLLVPSKAKNLPEGVEVITFVDDKTEAFIKPYLDKLLFRRGKDDLNWITQYPWIRIGTPNEESKRYYFSSVAKRFEFVQWRLTNNEGKIVGYAMLSVRDGHLKTPYVFVEDAYVAVLATAITNYMVAERLEMLTTFHPGLAQYFKQQKRPFIFVKSIRREYFASNAVSQYVKMGAQTNICDGDGDQAFT